jgi:transglutaminase-like putative cysteine protease
MVSPAARSNIAATLVFGAGVALVASEAPLWCAALALVCVAWRLAIGFGRIRAPAYRSGVRFAFGAVTALLVIAVAVSFRTLNGLAAGTALLVVMGALKLMEARTRRDDGIVIGVALFLLLAAALATQSLWRAPLYLLMVWGACAAIAIVAHANPQSPLAPRVALRLAVRALAMSLPLAAACFLLFPRVAGQFWALQRSEQATTGLSDEMSPGSIGTLATAYDPAFRARFTGELPARAALYWRGPVLNGFDGFTWRRDRPPYSATLPEPLGAAVHYRITLEPTNQPWMFALDTVDASPRRDAFLSRPDGQLTTSEPITGVMSYDAVSHLRTRPLATLTAYGRRFETRLPGDRNPRARALALQLRARAASDAEFARVALDWFRANGLEYTLEPGLTSLDSVDTTLFDTKRGFCGHFASAYATLMRAAGVPARVVTGYLGGEWNPAGGYLIVRQSDAHAWTEVWLENQGWTRIDPTAVVAPERLQRGIYDFMSASLPETTTFFHRNSWLHQISHLWDGANQWWQERVVEFDLGSQLEVLRRLGIDSPRWEHLGWAFAAGLILWIGWVSLTLRRSVARLKPDRIGRAWLDATRKLARVAPPRAPTEGPLAYAGRIAAARPELAAAVTDIALRYAALRFGPAANDAAIAELRERVRRLAV